jgi:hypothetical protein
MPKIHESTFAAGKNDPLFDTSVEVPEVTETPEVETPEVETDAPDNAEHSDLEAELLGLGAEDGVETTETEAAAVEYDERLTAYKADLTTVFGDVFKEQFGVSVDEAKAILAGADVVVAQQSVAQQEKTLEGLWGTEYKARLDAVAEHWQKLSPALQEKYDSLDGIQIIWEKIAPKFATQQKAQTSSKQTHKLLGTKTGGKVNPSERTASPTFKQSEIMSMSSADYNKQVSDIEKAYAEGRVQFDT